MMRLLVSMMAALVIGVAAPGWAEQAEQPSKSMDLNIDLKFDRDGFRLGGQFFGLDAVYGAWLNGQIRPDGLTLDGRVQDRGRAFNFKLNAEFTEWLLRSIRRDPI